MCPTSPLSVCWPGQTRRSVHLWSLSEEDPGEMYSWREAAWNSCKAWNAWNWGVIIQQYHKIGYHYKDFLKIIECPSFMKSNFVWFFSWKVFFITIASLCNYFCMLFKIRLLLGCTLRPINSSQGLQQPPPPTQGIQDPQRAFNILQTQVWAASDTDQFCQSVLGCQELKNLVGAHKHKNGRRSRFLHFDFTLLKYFVLVDSVLIFLWHK